MSVCNVQKYPEIRTANPPYLSHVCFLDYLASSPHEGCADKLRALQDGLDDKLRKLYSPREPHSTLIHADLVPENILIREVSRTLKTFNQLGDIFFFQAVTSI